MSFQVDEDIQKHIKSQSKLNSSFRNLLIVNAVLNNVMCQVLIDTGATCCLIPPRLASTQLISCPTQSITGINSKDNTDKQSMNSIRFGPHQKPIIYMAYLLNIARPILGNDFLLHFGVTINFFRKEINIGHESYPFFLNSEEFSSCMTYVNNNIIKVRVPKETRLPSFSTTSISCRVDKPGLLVPSVKTMENFNLIIPEIYFSDQGLHEIPVMNLNKHNVVLNANTTLGQIEDVEEVHHTNYELQSFCYAASNAPKMDFNINPQLDNSRKAQLQKFLEDYCDVFAQSEHDTGLYNGPEMVRLNTGNHPPISSPPYRKSHSERKIIQKHIQGLLEKGIIRESTSDWASPVLLVSKPDGGVRLCIDYRRLNQVLKDDKFPMGRLDDLFDSLYGAEYFSKLDIQAGFYNFQIHPDDREKTAFIVHDGLYEFNRVPFGLRTSPAVFNRMMRKIFGKLIYDKCFIYVDDLLVFGKTFEDHLVSLKEVFTKLLANNLKLKPSKCSFGYTEVKLLGHIVGRNGICVDPEKVVAIQRLPIPTTPTEVKSVLGLASFYRRFIPHFSDISRPLTNLTKKEVKFVWTQTCQKAFEILKEKLITAPILTQFDDRLSVILYTDASNYGLGALLCQIQNGVERVIAYASRMMNPSEQNFATSEKECLALIFALDKWREYCYGRKVIAYVDHLALLSLLKTKNSKNLRLARWVLSVQESDIEIRYMRGKTLLHADALSRIIPFEEKESSSILPPSRRTTQVVSNLVGVDYRSYLIDSQLADQSLKEIRKTLKLDPKDKTVRNYKVINKILYYEDPIKHRLLICIPHSMVNEVLYANHDHPMSGHLGIEKTYQKVKQKYYINNLKNLVYKYCRNCVECAKRTSSSHKKIGYIKSGEIYQLFDKIYVDTVGPLVETKKKNKHIIVCVDYFSKYVVTKAIKSLNAVTIAKFLMDNIFLMFGCSREIVMDNAKIHHSNLMKELLVRVGTRPIYITPYHHQSNSVERVNRTLQEALSKYISQAQTDWDVHLPSCTFALNTAVHSSTQYSPYQIVFGKAPNLPIDVLFDVPTIPYVENSQKIRTQVRENILRAQQRYGTQYNEKRVDKRYPVDSKVMIAEMTVKPGLSRKLSPKFMGPYRILKQVSPLHYKVKHMSSAQKPITVHVNRMKPFGNTKLLDPDAEADSDDKVTKSKEEEYLTDESDEDVSQFQYQPPRTTQQPPKKRSKANSPANPTSNTMQRVTSGILPRQVPVPSSKVLKTSHRKLKRLRLPQPIPAAPPATALTTRSGRIVKQPIRFRY